MSILSEQIQKLQDAEARAREAVDALKQAQKALPFIELVSVDHNRYRQHVTDKGNLSLSAGATFSASEMRRFALFLLNTFTDTEP